MIQQITVTLALHVLPWDEPERRAVDTIPQAAPLRRTVVENMSEVRAANAACDLGPDHTVGQIAFFAHDIRVDRL